MWFTLFVGVLVVLALALLAFLGALYLRHWGREPRPSDPHDVLVQHWEAPRASGHQPSETHA